MKGNGITRPLDVPINNLRKKIKSYHALLLDGRIQDLTKEDMDRFKKEVNLHYSGLSEDEKSWVNEIKDGWKPKKQFKIL